MSVMRTSVKVPLPFSTRTVYLQPMRSSLLIAATAFVLLEGLCAIAPAFDATDSAKRSCKGGKVAVKAGRRNTCVPFAKVFPKPKAVDLRLAYLKQALKLDPSKAFRGKQRKRAQKKVIRLLPKALAFFDRKRGGARSSAGASANCGVGAAGPQGSLGGSSTVGMLGENGGFIETDAGHGLRVRVTFFSCGGVDSFRVPECPTGAGDVVAPARTGDFSATTEIWQGNELK